MSSALCCVNNLNIAWVCEEEGVWRMTDEILDIYIQHTLSFLCKGWCVSVCRRWPCVMTLWSDWSSLCVYNLQLCVCLVCLITVVGVGGVPCWVSRNWNVECLIDQASQPWGDCLSDSSSLSCSRCEALSLSVCGSYILQPWTKELVWTHWLTTVCTHELLGNRLWVTVFWPCEWKNCFFCSIDVRKYP